MDSKPRWFTETKEGHAQWYIERFRTMASEGADLEGEARLVDALARPGSRILDAGCGPGRVGAALHARGHSVVGVDVDPELIVAAQNDHPDVDWRTADLSGLDLDVEPFDLVVMAGNVMVFLAPDSERRVLERLAAHVVPGGKLVIGFRRADTYPYERFDEDIQAAGLELQSRFGTWDLEPFGSDSDFAVSILRTQG